MTPDKTAMLKQINATIKKKWFKEDSSLLDSRDPLSKNSYLAYAKDLKSDKKLELRIESLEYLNDHLFNFINFLIENLPDLVMNVIHSEWETLQAINNIVEEPENNLSGPADSCATFKNIYPCPTKREKDILELLVKGLCAKEIANRLFISETTVITHKKNLKEKFNVKNTVELVSKANNFLTKVKKN